MKKHLLTSTLFLALGMTALAQGSARQVTAAGETPTRLRTEASLDRNLLCGPDTVLYTYLKEVELYGGAAPVFYTTNWFQNEGLSQAFNLSAPVTIRGIDFYARVKDIPNPAQTITVNVSLWSVNASYMPVAPIATATCLVTTTGAFRQAIFASPVTISTNYAVVVTNPSATDTLQIFTNNATASTYGEGLGYLTYGGSWYTNADPVNGFAQDLEGLISPIIEYNIATNYTMSPAATTMCLGTALTFTNTTTPTAILTNRMYNYGSFLGYWYSTPDSIYAWDMNDGSPLQWSTNAAYTYPAAGPDTVTLITLGGLFKSCVDFKDTYLNITPNAVASYTQNTTASPSVTFTSTSTGAATYAWDFGDGSPIDNTANPVHVYATAGIYTVTLTVTSPGTCNTSTTSQSVIILSTGISSASLSGIKVYPNPSATGIFTVELIGAEANVEVFNTLGEMVHASLITSTSSLDLSGLGAGIYSMRVISEGKNSMKQIVITK